MYRSSNGGQSFSLVSLGSPNFFIIPVTPPATPNNQGEYDNTLWVDPTNANTIIVGGIDLWRSVDGGINFTQISLWSCGPGQQGSCAGKSPHADQHIIVADPSYNGNSNKKVFFGNDGGLFRTDDVLNVGQQNGWVDLNHGLGITQ